MKRIVFGTKVSEKHLVRTREIAPDWEIMTTGGPEGTRDKIGGAEIYVDWAYNFYREIVEKADQVKWIQSLSAGVDMLPMDLIKEKGIVVTNASGIHKIQISENVFGYMLMFVRGLNKFYELQKERKWDKSPRTTELYEKTMGIIGAGSIGSEIARLGKAFGMKVLGLRKSGKPEEYYDVMYTNDGLKELLIQSDFVVSCIPLTDETQHLLGEEEFKAMKPTAYFINISRGSVVDEKALVKALKEGWIKGAGLDVFEEEPLPVDSPLWDMPNVIITPHVAGLTDRYMERAMKLFNDNLERYLKGENLINVVDPDRGY
ncbi:MAG: D-2-hydroxyacid dehydrogenase [Thermoanaerobacteraceae bacterium]|nr:D-2-hydroxyacid dehydrogenase [Thermoanaerobacteraceae bacterium]